MYYTISHAGLSHVGHLRTANEDRWFADPRQGLYLVADGIGGSSAGGLASRIVAEVLPRLLWSRLQGAENGACPDLAEQVSAALSELSERLREESRGVMGLTGMGSTVVLVLLRGRKAVVAHMGDSRAYLLRAGRLDQLTKDHTIAQLLVDHGELAPEEAASHPARGHLTRFVGMVSEALPETETFELRPGDRLLLCSDGLTCMLTAEEIRDILSRKAALDDTCQQLIDAANQSGGKDNVTAVIVAVAETAAG
jgi:serine/threonine protein phosphatase PrpC